MPDTLASGLDDMLHSRLIDRIWRHAVQQSESPAIEYYDADLRLQRTLTYLELYCSALRLANRLAPQVVPGDAVLVALGFGVDYVIALAAVQLVGGVAIPGMPATRRSAPRLEAMLRVGNPKVLLHDGLTDFTLRVVGSHQVAAVDVSGWALGESADCSEPPRHFPLEDSALLQFTSGSTATPKAVVLTHANLAANQVEIARGFRHSGPVRALGWLPLYHDMGLIGNIMQPLYTGGTAVMISSMNVVARPISWLKLIQKSEATTSGGPNFIYDLCVRTISPEEVSGLDLSRWKVAFNGSETVRAHTLRRFTEKFAIAGFSERAFFPCYGMAEASVFVTGAPFNSQNSLIRKSGTPCVNCGPLDGETRVIVADPVRLTTQPEGVEGEIFISGPSVASAYLTEQGYEQNQFNYQIDSVIGKFHRTGDVGINKNNCLFVTGRIKDIVKINGVSYHSEDIELVIERDCDLIEPHSTCAITTINGAGEEQVGVLIELSSRNQSLKPEIESRVRSAVSSCEGLHLSSVIFVGRGALPRTSSGKFLRWRCRELAAEGKFSERVEFEVN